MADRGQPFRGPADAGDIYTLLDPATDGYGIAAGGDTPRPDLGGRGPDPDQWTDYETALYGAPLGTDGNGGCAAVGYQVLTTALNTLETMPYTIEQLEADALADPTYVAATGAWVECMSSRGYSATSPDDLLASLSATLRTIGGDEARALAGQEIQTATDDFACRSQTLDPATEVVAQRLAPQFLEANRVPLETLIPPPDAGEGPDLPSGLGSGDVQVTIIWNSKADLDLSVLDPAGSRIYYSNPTSPSGGALDRDANFPCGSDPSSPAAENVFWPTGGAPAGTYLVNVNYTSDCLGEGSQSFDLIVQVRGRVIHQERHTLTARGDWYDFEFTVGLR
jgi:hypothetical protein